MKKIISLVFVFIVLMNLFGCSIPAQKPETGVWYCEELKLSIDFSMSETPDKAARLYDDNGDYIYLTCHFDYGNGVSVADESGADIVDYLIGAFRVEQDEFIVERYTDGKEFVFIKDAEVPTVNLVNEMLP